MFGTSFGSTLSKLGQVAEEVSQSLDGGIQSVALNIGQAIRENIRGGGANGPEEENVLRGSSHSSRRGSGSAAASAGRAAGTTSSNSTSSSTVATPDSEEVS